MNINTIIFDLGAVIIDLDELATPKAFAALSYKSEEEVIALYLQSPIFKKYEMGLVSSQEFRVAINQLLDTKLSDDEIDHAWNAMLGELPVERLHFINSLRAHYKVLILSNTNDIHEAAFNKKIKEVSGEDSLLPFADHVYLSQQMGKRKPNQNIYQQVLNEQNLIPQRTIFLDDKLENLEGAASVGIQTMHIQNPNEIFNLKEWVIAKKKEKKTKLIQLGLFILTLVTTTLSGAEWITGKHLFFGEETIGWADFFKGLPFSLSFLTILTFHEFGHYFVAKYHQVKVTLPYYIPMWLGFLGGPSIGTMGAFIKIKENVSSRKKYFDIGIAGPLAGFVIAIMVITYGFTNLPPVDFIYDIHPEYEQWGTDYPDHAYADRDISVFLLGPNLIFWFFETYIADTNLIPHTYEAIHYPYLFAGYLALFFTALNLLPIGQLDGGHIMYGLIGPKKHRKFSQVFFIIFIYYAGLGMFSPFAMSEFLIDEALYIGFIYFCLHKFTPKNRDKIMYALGIFSAQLITTYIFPNASGYSGWLLFSFILGRFLGIYHPPVLHDQPLDLKRKVLGWISVVVFILCFSPRPFDVVEIQSKEDKSETPTVLSDTKPSPYLTLIDIPNSLPLESKRSMNSGVEIKVLDAVPEGSKN